MNSKTRLQVNGKKCYNLPTNQMIFYMFFDRFFLV